MINNDPFIHRFKTANGSYIYDVNTNSVLRVNEQAFNALKDKCDNNDILDKMAKNGFLSSKRVSEMHHPASAITEDLLKSSIQKITLQVTQQCNLRCAYCIYSGDYDNRGHSNKKMSFEIAKMGIDFLIKHSGQMQNINVGFYGGEPLLEFETIKKCIEYANTASEGKDISYSITTNGTILSDEMLSFIESNNVYLVISLDGPKHIHDSNRKLAGSGAGSYDIVIKNIENLKSKFPKCKDRVSFSIVMDPRNDFNCISEFFTNFEAVKEFNKISNIVSDNYSRKEIGFNKQFVSEMIYEDFKLFLYKLKRLKKEHISELVERKFEMLKRSYHEPLKSVSVPLPGKYHHGGPCVPGQSRLFMDVNGNFYPCERVSESSETMKIGDIYTGFNVDKCMKIMNIGKLTEDNCKNCWAIRFCQLCVASADGPDGLSAERKLKKCVEMKMSVESSLKDYCTLVEYGYNFDEEAAIIDFDLNYSNGG